MALEFQCGLVHEPISVRDSIEILDATAALVKEWNKLKHLLAWDFRRVRPNADVVFDARDKHRSVHSASLMQLCHLKLAELATLVILHSCLQELRIPIAVAVTGPFLF